jgi:hypothetical protein
MLWFRLSIALLIGLAINHLFERHLTAAARRPNFRRFISLRRVRAAAWLIFWTAAAIYLYGARTVAGLRLTALWALLLLLMTWDLIQFIRTFGVADNHAAFARYQVRVSLASLNSKARKAN